MTQHLARWKVEADAMEIPFSIQKGLLYAKGVTLCIFDKSSDGQDSRRLLHRLSHELPDLPTGRVPSIYDVQITDLLVEAATKLDPGFKPRIIDYPSGYSLPSYSPHEEDRLPDIDPDRREIGEWGPFVKSLFQQIGDHIDDDLEGAVIGGALFANSMGRVDIEATGRLAELLRALQTPHMQWVNNSINFDLGDLGDAHEDKILFAYFGQTDFGNLARDLSTNLLYCGGNSPRPEAVHADLITYTMAVIDLAPRLLRDPQVQGLLPKLRKELEGGDAHSPSTGLSRERALDSTLTDIQRLYGLQLYPEPQNLYFGERLDRRCCVIDYVLTRTILNPNWVVS